MANASSKVLLLLLLLLLTVGPFAWSLSYSLSHSLLVFNVPFCQCLALCQCLSISPTLKSSLPGRTHTHKRQSNHHSDGRVCAKFSHYNKYCMKQFFSPCCISFAPCFYFNTTTLFSLPFFSSFSCFIFVFKINLQMFSSKQPK